MGHLETKQQDAIWAALQELSRAEAEGQAYAVSIVKFGSVVENATPFKAASSYTRDELSTVRANMHNTALLDAIGHAATILGNRNTEAQLIQLTTDGDENASRNWQVENLKALLLARADRLTLAVAGPSGAKYLMSRIGLSPENFKSWDGVTETSFRATTQATTSAIATYTQARSKGTRSVSNFYTVDPSKLNAAGVRSMLAKVEPTEVQVVAKKMAGRAIADAFPKFEKGKHYYQLMKPEYIDESKELVVHIKDKGEYRLGSRSARMLLGLPETGRIRVKPVETTAPFEVFVQSASVNRKLVEGQKLLTVG